MVRNRARGWVVDILIGGIVGGLLGVIAAVNFVIYSGMERGYESTIGDVFAQSPLAGIVTVAILIGGPILGVVAARGWRSRARSKGPDGQPPSGNSPPVTRES